MDNITTPTPETGTKRTITKCYKMWHLVAAFGAGLLLAMLVLMASGQFFKGATIDLKELGIEEDLSGITEEDLGKYFDPNTGPIRGAIEGLTEELSEDVGEIQNTNTKILDELEKIKALLLGLQKD